MSTFRIHWPAVVVAMIVSFLVEAAWFSFFKLQWLAGIGRDAAWTPAVNAAVQFAVALLCALITAIVLSILLQWTGRPTLLRGVAVGALVWIGFVATNWATEYVFEVRTLEIFAINTFYSLINLILTGAIVGGWKPKPHPTNP